MANLLHLPVTTRAVTFTLALKVPNRGRSSCQLGVGKPSREQRDEGRRPWCSHQPLQEGGHSGTSMYLKILKKEKKTHQFDQIARKRKLTTNTIFSEK